MNLDKLKTHMDNMRSGVPMLEYYVHKYNDIIILGNGGSNAVASHISQDYTKKLGKKAITFSDSSRLTCYINDYGMENAYSQFVKEFATEKTLVILISSSGNSDNIVNAAKTANEIGCPLITMSGFKKDNKLNQIESIMNYWVDSEDYGEVELSHEIFLHTIC